MNMFRKATLALSLAAAVGAIATPSFAQTTQAQRMAAREARAQAQYAQMQWNQQNLRGAYAWQYTQSPNECVTDEGYGRTSFCSGY